MTKRGDNGDDDDYYDDDDITMIMITTTKTMTTTINSPEQVWMHQAEMAPTPTKSRYSGNSALEQTESS